MPSDVSSRRHDQIVLDLAEARVSAMTGETHAAISLLGRARSAAEGIDMVVLTDELEYEAAGIAAVLGDEREARALLAGLVERHEARGLRRFADRYRRDLEALG